MPANDQLRTVALSFILLFMNLHRALVLSLICLALTGCTRAIEVRVELSEGQPALTFFTKGLLPHRLETICLWSAEIIDEASGKAALKLLASDHNRSCVRVSRVAFNRHQPGLKKYPQNSGLIQGRVYHADILADEGIGRSAGWVQP